MCFPVDIDKHGIIVNQQIANRRDVRVRIQWHKVWHSILLNDIDISSYKSKISRKGSSLTHYNPGFFYLIWCNLLTSASPQTWTIWSDLSNCLENESNSWDTFTCIGRLFREWKQLLRHINLRRVANMSWRTCVVVKQIQSNQPIITTHVAVWILEDINAICIAIIKNIHFIQLVF